RIAGDDAPTAGLGRTVEDNKKARTTWENWWAANKEKADLSRLQKEDAFRGFTVVCEYDGNGNGRVWEFGKDGKQRWEVTGMPGANDVQVLPGGRILVAERNSGKVTERNLKGTVLWEHAVPSPIAAQRLPNGNTLICTFNQILEVSPDKKTVREHNNG